MPTDPAVRRMALACLVLGFVGPRAPYWLKKALADGLGGVVLFGSNLGTASEVAALTSELRGTAEREIILATDEEGGDVTRLDTRTGSASPGAAALGHLDDVDTTEESYAAIGMRLRDAGLTMNLAPVGDVNLDPLNPVIGVRSFSADPERAGAHVAAAVRGLQRTGIAACVKHFPGHGATRTDSHHALAVLDRDRAALQAAELVPFQAGIAAGTRSVMTGHLLVPSLDPGQMATVSRLITTRLLREELGFDGAIFTDALEMKALSGTVGMVEGFVQALVAGADAIETGAQEYPELVEAIPAAVEAALRDGRLTEERLVDAANRAAALAVVMPLEEAQFDRETSSGAAARCVEVIGFLPRAERPLVIECRTPGGMASGELPWSLARPLSELVAQCDSVQVTGSADIENLSRRAAGRSLVVLVRDPLRSPWQQPYLDLAARHPASVVIDVGWPAPLRTSDGSPIDRPVVRTRGVAPGLLEATARLIAAGSRGEPDATDQADLRPVDLPATPAHQPHTRGARTS